MTNYNQAGDILLSLPIVEENVITSEDLGLLVKRRPFKPFRITMATTEMFDVWHPDIIIVGRSIAALGLDKAGEEPIADGIIWLDLDQIVHIPPAIAPGKSAAQ